MARKTGSVNHVHQYFRRPDGLWACSGIEDCTHFMPKNTFPAPVGKMSICWSCFKKFQLMWKHMEDEDTDKPFCDVCVERVALVNAQLDAQDKADKEVVKSAGLPQVSGKHMSYCDIVKGESDICSCGVDEPVEVKENL